MFKMPFLSPARIAEALLHNLTQGTTPEAVAQQLANVPGVAKYIQGATVESLWGLLMDDEKARAAIGPRARQLHEYVTGILQAAQRSVPR